MGQYRDQGIVLRGYRLGEADRIIVLATQDHGKVRAVAKGIRRTKSRIGARLEPLSHVSMLVWEGRNLDVVNQVEVLDSYPAIRASLDKLSAGAAIAEVADRIFQEGTANPSLYSMLTKVIATLDGNDSPIIVPAFFLKVLACEGVGPVVDRCVACESPGPLVSFDPEEGGALCRSCRRGRSLSPEVLDVLVRILTGGLAGVLAEDLGDSIVGDVRHLATEAMEYHLESRLRCMALLEKV
ncbi:MAG TPA: DNA repair protein RecO [Acidimicrobiales bacterium]|nr:DNA repair protein RecO [Acidimicrobiales bacterium]